MNRVAIAVLLTLGAVALLGVAAALFVARVGPIDVSARQARAGLLHWFLATTRESSVERQASGIEVPDLRSPEMKQTGMAHYQGMCAGCHGAPGREDSDVRRGLNPAPPSFLDESVVRDLDPREAFWVVSNGIWMSGMPAFGPTHAEEEIWAIVAALEDLPSTSAEEYRQLVSRAGGHHQEADPDQDNSHHHDTHAH